MGTKVHFRSYFPGHDKMRDLNTDVGNHLPSFYISKTLNEHLYNGCLRSPSTGQSEFDKEMLKRTMLEHEAIFRRQVYELHRLYGIQKDLMEELQNNGLSAVSEHKVPSKTISCSSQVQSGFSTRMWQMPHPFAMKNCQKRGKSGYNDDIIYPVKLLESNLQSSSGFFETESLQKVAEWDSSFRKCPKSMLDFRLPAKKSEIPGSSPINTSTSRICTEDSDMELKLDLISVNGSSGKGVRKLNYLYNKSLFTGLADLNEPNRQASFDGVFPDMFFGSKSKTEENNRLKYPLSSTTLSMQNAFTNDGDCGGERAFSNVFQGVKEEISRGAVCHNEAELFPITSHKEKNYMLCEPAKLNVNNVSSINSIDHNEASTQFGHEQNHHLLIPGKFPEHSESGNLGKLTSVFPNSFSTSLKLESKVTSVPIVPTWMKLSSHENHFSEISNTTDISIKDPNDSSGSWRVGIDLKSPLRFEEKCSSHLNGLNDELQSTSQKKVPFANINLNVEAENPFYGTQDGQTIRQSKATKDINGKYEELLPELSWPERRPACASLELSRLPSQVDLEFSRNNRVYEKKSDDSASLSSRNFYACSSSLHKRKIEVQTDQPPDSSSRTKFIASYSEKLQEKSSSPSNEEKLVIDELKHVGTSHDIIMYSSEKSTTSENNKRNCRNSIDLNSVFPFEDGPDSSENSAEVQADPPAIHSDPILVSEAVALIDLEAPVMNLEEGTPSLQQELCSSETNIKEAAENIVKLSQDNFKLNKEIETPLSPISTDNALYMFAEMILSNNNIIESHPDVGLDLFEQMTLQLEEMKPENSWRRPNDAAENGQTNVSKALLLLAKPRRAQGKKRRQKRDFQKDILPALATLSRQESMEDLQAIGELMKASGSPWQAGIRRRNMRQNGAKAQPIRKNRVQINPPTAFFMVDGENYNPELEVERHHMIGWGRTTRRCRSQRCPSASFSSTLM